jgi:D-lactate dehydrogenase
MLAIDDNYHMINKNSIEKMKEGVFIINTARGFLIDTNELIKSIQDKKIGGVAQNLIENETDIYYKDLKGEIINNKEIAILNFFPNVILTPHVAVYTDQAVSDMFENLIKSCILFLENKENPCQVR